VIGQVHRGNTFDFSAASGPIGRGRVSYWSIIEALSNSLRNKSAGRGGVLASIDNAGEPLSLSTRSRIILDSAMTIGPWPTQADGWAILEIVALAVYSDPANWRASPS